MSALFGGGIYYNDWHAWQADDMQRVSQFADAEKLYSYYVRKVLLKREKEKFRGLVSNI